jgi:polyhydroxybutyrate depolymerase
MRVLAASLALISLPAGVAVTEAIAFHTRFASNGTIVSSGDRREYRLYVPPAYDSTKPTPLVISLHGAALYGEAQMEISRWNDVADREGFLVVYPSGRKGRGPRTWQLGYDGNAGKDVRFISELIDTLAAHYSVDRARIYANGLSNGGGMTFALSCALPGRIAAFGTVGAAWTEPWSWCRDTTPAPFVSFHGTADPQALYEGGKSIMFRRPWPSVRGWTANWARRNRCSSRTADTLITSDVTRLSYLDCDAPVVLYTIHGGGHTWPGGGPVPEWWAGSTTHTISASELMWRFFEGRSIRTSVPASDPRAMPAAPGRSLPRALRGRAARPTTP